MSSSKKLPPHPLTTSTTIIYGFVWEVCYDEDPKPPTPDSDIRVTRLNVQPKPKTEPTQTDSLSDLDPTTTPPKPLSPRVQTINDAWDNGYEYKPCTAVLTWRNYVATFYGQYNDHLSKFSHWILDENATNQAFLGDWEGRDVQISHTPASGFHGLILSGTPILDDADRRMLFVKLDAGLAWAVKLYGKLVLEGEVVQGLSDKERERLMLDREGYVGGKRVGS